MNSISNEREEKVETKEIKRVDSFEIEKPFISDNESDSGKKDGSSINMVSPSKAEYDSRFLTLSQVSLSVPLKCSFASHLQRILPAQGFFRFRMPCIM